MPTPTDLEDRLAAYGRALRAEVAPITLDELHPAPRTATATATRQTRRLPILAVAAVVVAFAVGVLLIRQRSERFPATTQPAAAPTSPAPVTTVAAPETTAGRPGSRTAVLPGAYPALETASFGDVRAQLLLTSLDARTVQAVVGRLDGGHLSDSVGIVAAAHGPTADGSRQPVPVDVAGRPAMLYTDPAGVRAPFLVVPMGDTDLTFVGVAAQAFADAQLEAIQLDAGPVGLRIGHLTDGYVVVAQPTVLYQDAVEATLDVGAGRATVTVSAQPRFPGDGATSVDVGGHVGWLVDGQVSWRQAAGTWVVVESSSSGEDALSIARALTFVDQATFVGAGQATPDFGADVQLVPAPADPSVSAFGESVMLGAHQQLQTAGVVLDVAENRQAADMVAVVQGAAATGNLGDTVVVQVGTNGTITAEQLDEIVAAVGGRQLYLLTVKANQPWIDGNNERIRALPSQVPQRARDRLAAAIHRDRRRAQHLRRRRPPAHEAGDAVLRQHGRRGDRPRRPRPAARLRRRWRETCSETSSDPDRVAGAASARARHGNGHQLRSMRLRFLNFDFR